MQVTDKDLPLKVCAYMSLLFLDINENRGNKTRDKNDNFTFPDELNWNQFNISNDKIPKTIRNYFVLKRNRNDKNINTLFFFAFTKILLLV